MQIFSPAAWHCLVAIRELKESTFILEGGCTSDLPVSNAGPGLACGRDLSGLRNTASHGALAAGVIKLAVHSSQYGM